MPDKDSLLLGKLWHLFKSICRTIGNTSINRRAIALISRIKVICKWRKPWYSLPHVTFDFIVKWLDRKLDSFVSQLKRIQFAKSFVIFPFALVKQHNCIYAHDNKRDFSRTLLRRTPSLRALIRRQSACRYQRIYIPITKLKRCSCLQLQYKFHELQIDHSHFETFLR